MQAISQRAEELAIFDRPGTWLAQQVRRLIKEGPAKNLLSGTWLGHPLHPLLTDVPIGAWASALVLDLLGGKQSRPAAEMMVGLGLMGAVPTAAAGLTDFSDTFGVERRGDEGVAAIGSQRARRFGQRSSRRRVGTPISPARR